MKFIISFIILSLFLCLCAGQVTVCEYPFTSTCDGCAEAESGNFPDCWYKNPNNGHYYILSSEAEAYNSALDLASHYNVAAGSYLATISSKEEATFIRDNFPGVQFWVAGIDYQGQGSWYWNTGDETHFVFYTKAFGCASGWYCNFTKVDAPCNQGPQGVVVNSDGSWKAVPWTTHYRFLIEVGSAPLPAEKAIVFNSANNHIYRHVNSPGLTWAQANAQAASTPKFFGFTGHLVTVETPEEFNFLQASYGRRPHTIYLGGSKSTDGTRKWKWTSGDNSVFYEENNINCATFSMWAIPEPNGDQVVYWRAGPSSNWAMGWVDFYSWSNDVYEYIIEYECDSGKIDVACSEAGCVQVCQQ